MPSHEDSWADAQPTLISQRALTGRSKPERLTPCVWSLPSLGDRDRLRPRSGRPIEAGEGGGGRWPGYPRDDAGRHRLLRQGTAGRWRGPVHAARRCACRPGARPHPDSGLVPGLRAAIGPGIRRPRVPGLPRRGRCRSVHLDEVLDTIMEVGSRAGVPAAGGRCGRRPSSAVGRGDNRGRRTPAAREWRSWNGWTPHSHGHWVPDLVTAAGGAPVAGRPGARSGQTTWDKFIAAEPDLVLVTPCGFHLDGAADQARTRLRPCRECRSGLWTATP